MKASSLALAVGILAAGIAGSLYLRYGVFGAQELPFATSALVGNPTIVTLLREDGASVEFIGATPGLAGYRVTRGPDDAGYTVYVTPSGHAVVGTLYAPDGLLVTAEQIAAMQMDAAPSREPAARQARAGDPLSDRSPPPEVPGPAPAATATSAHEQSGRLASSLPDNGASGARPPATRGFTLGSSGRMVHVFADPACPFSRSTVARFARAALEGELRLKVIPVALLGADSAYQALAAVGDDGATAWFDRRAMQPTPEAAAAVRQNNAAHAATGHGVVPVVRIFDALAWRDHAGAVDDVARFLVRAAAARESHLPGATGIDLDPGGEDVWTMGSALSEARP